MLKEVVLSTLGISLRPSMLFNFDHYLNYLIYMYDAGILKSLRHKTWVDETPHEVKGTNDTTVDTPRRARINSLKQVSLFDQHLNHRQ